MTMELKACPFCGGAAIIHKDNYVETLRPERYPEGGRSWVGCRCSALHKYNTQAEAIAAWNQRTPDPEILALRARVAELEGDLRKANNPLWFYHPDHTEVCMWSPHEVVDDYYDPASGEHVFEVECARPLPSIWCAVRVTADEDADERFTLTEHATEEEARAALSKGEATEGEG